MTTTPEKVVRRWLADQPTAQGFATDLGTGPRLASLIRQEFGIPLHPWSLGTWLRDRGFTPRKPRRVPRQRDPELIATGLDAPWPRIPKKPGARRPPSP